MLRFYLAKIRALDAEWLARTGDPDDAPPSFAPSTRLALSVLLIGGGTALAGILYYIGVFP